MTRRDPQFFFSRVVEEVAAVFSDFLPADASPAEFAATVELALSGDRASAALLIEMVAFWAEARVVSEEPEAEPWGEVVLFKSKREERLQ